MVYEGENPMVSRCAAAWRIVKVTFVSLSLLLAVLDLGTDWWAVKDYIDVDDGGSLTIALTFFTCCATLLFVMEVYNGVMGLRLYGMHKGYADEVELWREVLSFGLLVLEDLPVTVIMYVAFRWGSCPLYVYIFEDSKVGRLTLLASFISSLLKGALSLKYCLQVVLKENYSPWTQRKRRKQRCSIPEPSSLSMFRQSGTHSRSTSRPRPSRQVSMTWQDRLFCCSCVRCRPLRILLNTLVCIFTAYVCFTVNRQDMTQRRPECSHLISDHVVTP